MHDFLLILAAPVIALAMAGVTCLGFVYFSLPLARTINWFFRKRMGDSSYRRWINS